MPFSAPFSFPDLSGKTLCITGITSGIGLSLLPHFFAQGLRIVAISKGMSEMLAVRENLGATEAQLALYDCDLADPAAVAATGEAILRDGHTIDFLYHNAAIDPRHWFATGDDLFWQQVMQVNLLSAVALTRTLLPRLQASTQGRILFTGSIIYAQGGACLTAYSASKGAVTGVTRSLAHELQGTGITVNCVYPGAIKVEKEKDSSDQKLIDWQSIPRRLEPRDLLGIVCLLLSQWGGGITGQIITVDGGLVHPLMTPGAQGRTLPPTA